MANNLGSLSPSQMAVVRGACQTLLGTHVLHGILPPRLHEELTAFHAEVAEVQEVPVSAFLYRSDNPENWRM